MSVDERRQIRINVVLVTVTLACGLIGYARVGSALQAEVSSSGGIARALDVIYLALRLLWLGGTKTYGDFFLSVARWTGAVVAFRAVLAVAAPRLVRQWQDLRSSRRRGHSLVIGLGRKGAVFAREFSDAGVCVGLSLGTETAEGLPRAMIRLSGDATDGAVLRRAGAHGARRIVICTSDDFTNLAVLQRIDALRVRLAIAAPVEILLHLGERTLRLGRESAGTCGAGIMLRPFSVPQAAARQLLQRWSPAMLAHLRAAPGICLVFLGFDAYAEELLLLALRTGGLAGQHLPRIHVFEHAAAALAARLGRNYPGLAGLAELEFHEHDPDQLLTPAQLECVEPGEVRTAALVVTAASDEAAILRAVRLRQQSRQQRRWRAPLFVRLEYPVRHVQALAPMAGTRELAEVVEPFGAPDDLCTVAQLMGWQESLARSLHEAYAAAADATPDAALAWERLPEEYREANRRAVDHLPVKFAAAGWHASGAPPRLAQGLLPLSPACADRLARLEHASWVAGRCLQGWVVGAPRDDARRIHDCMVDFDSLDVQQQAKDFVQVTRSLAALADADPGEATVFRERCIGLVGHNELTLAQCAAAAAALAAQLLRMDAPHHLGPAGAEFWTFLTPFAPGADVVLARAVEACLEPLRGNGPRRYRIIVVAAAAHRVLAEAYLARQPDAAATFDGRQTLAALRAQAPEGLAAALAQRLADEALRRAVAVEHCLDLADAEGVRPAFERCDRYLLSRCADLIAVVEPARLDESGSHGTAQLVRRWLAGEGASGAAGGERAARLCRIDI